MNRFGITTLFVFNNCLPVKAAAIQSGHNVQYLRRLLREGSLTGMKLGQTGLIDKSMFENFLQNAQQTHDKRFGPNHFFAYDIDTVNGLIKAVIAQRERAQYSTDHDFGQVWMAVCYYRS